MEIQKGYVKAYSGGSLRDFLRQQEQALADTIADEGEAHILGVDEREYTEYLLSKFQLEPVQIETSRDQIEVEHYETDVPADYFPTAFNVGRGRSFTKPAVRFWVPIEGDWKLLNYQPTSWSLAPPGELFVSGGRISFEVVSLDDNLATIEHERDQTLSRIETHIGNVNKDVEGFNERLAIKTPKLLKQRKEQLLERRRGLASLGHPIRKREGVPDTFSGPSPKRKRIQVRKPTPKAGASEPEPTLPEGSYETVLTVIHEVGKQFERMPSTYDGKAEETLRDHMLLFLEPNFEGTAAGETFNKKGKTDILLRHEGDNIFVAECAFWDGPKKYTAKIDQLLGNLTWRDSKAAIILFVRNKRIQPVLESVADATRDHGNFVAEDERPAESWFEYRLHLPGDPSRTAHVAVLVFHFPTA